MALQSLDQLLRSQQLTFAFVGVAPSVLLLYGVWGWLRRLYVGEGRNKGRRRRYFHSVRALEELLLKAPEDDVRMSDKDRGLLIVTTSGLRVWATGIGSANREVSSRTRPDIALSCRAGGAPMSRACRVQTCPVGWSGRGWI